MNKVVKHLLIATLYLTVCFAIGQYRNTLKENSGIDSTQSDNSIMNVSNDSKNVVFEGNQQTTDTPWGITAGWFDMEGEGRCSLLTPNTAMELACRKSTVSLFYEIHPWVRESSDGLGFILWVTDAQGNILFEDAVEVDNMSNWQEYVIDLSKWENAEKLRITCNNGANNDDSADWLVIKTEISFNSSFGADEYVKAVTYFADEWPINFWNSEMDDLEADFQQIKDDGFNSIILVIPWREFQPCVSPITYNEYAFGTLDRIMLAAADADLDVYTRIGYLWDFYKDEDDNIADRFTGILLDNTIRSAWFDYVNTVYNSIAEYENFKGGFLTWEDFWGILNICDKNDIEMRLALAEDIGYQEWVSHHYELENYNNKYGTNYGAYSEILIPNKVSPDMYAMYEFYDEALNQLLKESQKYFFNLSMEVRLDGDVVYDLNGNEYYYNHEGTFLCENSDYISTMYGVPMGFDNDGNKVSYTAAMEKTEYILGYLDSLSAGKPIYIEQFIFADNTPDYAFNVQIKNDELDEYLVNISDILMNYAEGYGIWTYRNYCANMVYNAQFALGGEGWASNDMVRFLVCENSGACMLSEGGKISQRIPDIRNHFDSEEYIIEITVTELLNPCILEVHMGNEIKSLEITEIGNYKMVFSKNDAFDLMIKNTAGTITIDNIKLYSQIQEGFLYNEKNEELDCAESIRILNGKLQ